MAEKTHLHSQDQIPSLAGLKSLVIGLGILILVGVAVLIGTVFWRVSESVEIRTTVNDVGLTLPKGAVIREIDMGGEHLVLRLVFRDEPSREEILVVNYVTGQVESRIDVKREP